MCSIRYGICDAVQAESYRVDSIDVSNFVLPLYFTGDDELGGRNDFSWQGDCASSRRPNRRVEAFGIRGSGRSRGKQVRR